MLLLVFNTVTNIFRKNYISEIVENAPVQEERQENELKEDHKDKPKDINFIVKQK